MSESDTDTDTDTDMGTDGSPGRAVRPADAALAGAAAAAIALAAAELVAGLFPSVPSLVVAVADVVVDTTPGTVVRWTIDTLGRHQKNALIAGTVVLAIAVGALLGLAARRRFWAGAAGFAAFGGFGAWAAARGESSITASVLTAALAAAAGVAVLWWLLARAAPAAAPAPASVEIPGAVAGRRRFLLAAGVTALVAVCGAAAGRFFSLAGAVEEARARLATRLGSRPAPPAPAGVGPVEVEGISPLITPNADFYRIDTALLVPQVEPGGWTLRIKGLVERPIELDLDDLLAMEMVDEYVTLSCVSNEVGGDLVGNTWWTGVLLAELLDRAGVSPEAGQVVGRSVDGWTAGFPTEVAFDGRPAMVAVAMGGEPLPAEHGFPARLVVPGLYGYVSGTKWLAEIELTTWDGFDGYWIPRGWSKEGPIKTQSRIDVPRPGVAVTAGRRTVAGVAWAPTRRIERVEVRVDEEAWRPARLSGELSDNAWVQWSAEWDATAGSHRLQVRATDGTGETQTPDRAPPAPSGATGWHTVQVTVNA
jgi:DMSO/TMAO reductase YedYZ molybdopterin-dependent catalytic subunit